MNEILETLRQLTRILEDPHPGLASWSTLRNSVGERLRDQLMIALPPTDILQKLRDEGWMVGCHNDYRLDGQFHTFWLFTKDGRCVKGEGTSDYAALQEVAEQCLK